MRFQESQQRGDAADAVGVFVLFELRWVRAAGRSQEVSAPRQRFGSWDLPRQPRLRALPGRGSCSPGVGALPALALQPGGGRALGTGGPCGGGLGAGCQGPSRSAAAAGGLCSEGARGESSSDIWCSFVTELPRCNWRFVVWSGIRDTPGCFKDRPVTSLSKRGRISRKNVTFTQACRMYFRIYSAI